MARTKDPRLEEERRRLVTDAVMDLLAEGSWRSMTVEAVARRAGVSKGVVTYWFATKDDLIAAAIERFHARYEEQLLEVARSPRPVRERIEQVIELAFPDRETVSWELRFQTEVWSYAKGHPEILEAIVERYRLFREACQALIGIGVDEGYVTNPDPEGLFLFVQALVDGVSLHVAFDDEIDLGAVRRQLLALLDRWFVEPA